MKKKIYLIQPTYRDRNGNLLKGQSIFIHSLALPILSNTIPSDWEKEFCLEYFEDVNYETDASVIGISSMGYDLVHGIEIGNAFKKRGKTVIFGGYQAVFSKNLLHSICDSIVFGNPGPMEMKNILVDIEAGTAAPQYYCDSNINFPFDYSIFNGKRIQFMPLLSSVGCRNRCDFCCTAAVYKEHYRLRNPKHVLADLRAARRMTRYVGFVDSNIYNNRDYLLRLCSMIIKENLNIRWGAQTTIDIGEDWEVLKLLRRAGCGILFVGLETPHQASLDSVGKRYFVEGYRELIKRIHKAGISIAGYFIVGLDGDSNSTFEALFDLIHDARVNLPILNILLPAPGTKIFDRLKKEGRLLIQKEEEFLLNNIYYNTSCNRCFFIPKQMSVEEVEGKFIDLLRRLCSYRETIHRIVTIDPAGMVFLLLMNLSFREECKRIIAAHNKS